MWTPNSLDLNAGSWRLAVGGGGNLIQPSMFDAYAGSMKITTHLDHISRCRTASGTKCSSRWTIRVFIMNTLNREPETRNVVCGGSRVPFRPAEVLKGVEIFESASHMN